MELRQLHCFIAVADALLFGHAAQQLDMLPSALGRHIRLLEESLNVRLFVRSTRNVALTAHGHKLLEEGKKIVADVDALEAHFRRQGRLQARTLRIGAIDSAAIALVPHLLPAFRHACPDVDVQIDKNKTAQLLPKLKSGRLDMAFIRPMKESDPQLTTRFLLYENVVLAIAERHPLATRRSVTIEDIATLPLIVPARRARPHSHDVTIKLFNEAVLKPNIEAVLKPNIVQLVDEKQTILSMVASEVGGAIMPRWAARMATPHARFVAIDHGEGAFTALPLAVGQIQQANAFQPHGTELLCLRFCTPETRRFQQTGKHAAFQMLMLRYQQVFNHRHFTKQTHMLEGADHAHAGNLLSRQPLQMAIAQHDGAARRTVKTGQAVKYRGFTCAVWPDQRDDFALIQI